MCVCVCQMATASPVSRLAEECSHVCFASEDSALSRDMEKPRETALK